VTISLDPSPVAVQAWTRLRDEILAILGDDLVALWAYGGSIFPDRPRRLGDLDTFAVLEGTPDERTVRALERIHSEVERENGVDLDIWYVLAADARESEPPPHAFEPGRRATEWAINRAHWFAGAYIELHGRRANQLVLAPTWPEIETALSRELEHLERHVVEGDDDAFEATYAIWNGSRILHAIETRDVAISKRSAGMWALEHLPPRWHDAIHAADHAYDGTATPEDEVKLRRDMAPFVAMVRERLPLVEPRAEGEPPRWGGS